MTARSPPPPQISSHLEKPLRVAAGHYEHPGAVGDSEEEDPRYHKDERVHGEVLGGVVFCRGERRHFSQWSERGSYAEEEAGGGSGRAA